MTTPVVELHQVTRRFSEGTFGCRDVSMRIDSGEMVAIVGKSGSGKSTLLNILGLLDRSDGGTYTLMGVDVGRSSGRELASLRAAQIGFVFQSFHLQSRRTVRENVQTGALYSGVPVRDRRRRAAEILEQLDLAHRVDAVPAVLSGGERQRTAIARALVSDPALLLCDEPTGNLDSANSAQVIGILSELRRTGTTVLIVTHDLDVAAHADSVYTMSDGRSTRSALTND